MLAPSAITQLSLALSRATLSDSDKAKAVCQCMLTMLHGLRRVSVWRIDAASQQVQCLAMMMPGRDAVVPDTSLCMTNHADVIDQLQQHQVIISRQGPAHPVIQQLNRHCECAPNAATAVHFRLDQNQKIRGFLTCESGAPATDWTDTDRLLLSRIASTAALFI